MSDIIIWFLMQLGLIFTPMPGWTATMIQPRPAPEPAAVTCFATATGRVNMRRGPDITFELEDVLNTGETLGINAQAIGSDGFVWWRLENNAFVRSDTVSLSGICDAIPSAANR
jgi:hypothetical protein